MGTNLKIDRCELADTSQAKKLAELTIQQLQHQLPQLLPIPIEEVASACGIEDIKEIDTNEFEGGLIQNPEKTRGFVLVKSGAIASRRRFTIAHELGHFLNPHHIAPEGKDQLLCTAKDLKVIGAPKDPRLSIEAQANEFAANLLMPESSLRAVSGLWGSPQLQNILEIQVMCGVSKESAARRYVEMHGDNCAIVFSQDNKFRYAIRSVDFPVISLQQNQPIFNKSLTARFHGEIGLISEQDESDSFWWLTDQHARQWQVWEEVLIQQNGFKMTLLLAEVNASDEEDDLQESWTARFH